MLKKLVIAAVAIVIGLVVVKKTQLGSLLRVWWKDAVACVDKQVPPETRIKQLNLEIAKIDDTIRSAIDHKVDMRLQVNSLTEEVEGLKKKQDGRRNDMKTLIEGLQTVGNGTRVAFKGDALRQEAAQEKLDSLRVQFENVKETLKLKEQVLHQKQEHLEVTTQRIEKIKNAKSELTALVAKLETQLEVLRLKQIENGTVEVDDSQVSKCVELAENLKKQITKQEMLASELGAAGLTPGRVQTKEAHLPPVSDSIKAAQEALGER